MTKNSLGNLVAEDTARARKGITPPILVDSFGGPHGPTPPPVASQFGKGAQTLAQINEATTARREAGAYYRNTKQGN